MTGTDGNNLTYTPGGERIPENWYTYDPETPYAGPAFSQDLGTIIQQHPELLALGGNTGTVNSFTGLDVQNLTVSSSTLPFQTQIQKHLSTTLLPRSLVRQLHREVSNHPDEQGGLYNAATLLEGDNLACFLLQSVAVAAPDFIREAGVIADIAGAVSQINNAVGQATINLNCPQLSQYEYDSRQLNQYPGYTRLKADGTYS